MARKQKSEGRSDAPPSVGHDELIDQIEALNRSDEARQMIASEDREAVQEFLEATNLNPRAFSWCRSILKMKDHGKAMDLMRSLDLALPMVRAHLTGQQPELFSDDCVPLDPVPEAVPPGLRSPSYEADEDFLAPVAG